MSAHPPRREMIFTRLFLVLALTSCSASRLHDESEPASGVSVDAGANSGAPANTAPPTRHDAANEAPLRGRDATQSRTPARASILRIHDIQSPSHVSPYAGTLVSNIEGIVTALGRRGFYVQDPEPDDDVRTSEGIFVFTNATPAVRVGDLVRVSGTVREFRPGCAACTASSSAHANLSVTEIDRPGLVSIVSRGERLPSAVRIGEWGRRVPHVVIENDALGFVDAATRFDPEEDALDLYESLEGMRVEIRNATVIGPTRAFHSRAVEAAVLADFGAGAGQRTARSGLLISETESGAARLFLSNALGIELPELDVADRIPGSIHAIVDYGFGAFKFLLSEPLPPVAREHLTREMTELTRAPEQLTAAAFNTANLSARDSPERFENVARAIVDNLGAPDLLALSEIGDDNGIHDDSVVSARQTMAQLCAAITAAGGPAYQARWVDPIDDADGGPPGANIRVVILLRTDRGLSSVERSGAGARTPNRVRAAQRAAELVYSPGLIDPTHASFASSRKPLALELVWNGVQLLAIATHFKSKSGDQPAFGRFQPPLSPSEGQRTEQARVVGRFVAQALSIDPSARVIVLGDFNDFEFAAPLAVLEHAGLTALTGTLPQNERYTYVFDGKSQALDHILVSPALRSALAGFDVVHMNAEFTHRMSDHDPVLARFSLPYKGVP
jgi:hypothetical protein